MSTSTLNGMESILPYENEIFSAIQALTDQEKYDSAEMVLTKLIEKTDELKGKLILQKGMLYYRQKFYDLAVSEIKEGCQLKGIRPIEKAQLLLLKAIIYHRSKNFNVSNQAEKEARYWYQKSKN